VKVHANIIGLISDTHGLLRPEAVAALRGSDFIIHAGDVGNREIIDELQTIAPLIAVKGNFDTQPWTSELPVTAEIETEKARIYVIHNIAELDMNRAAGYQIVVSGHSHKPGCFERAGVLYINPGSAGRRRFDLPLTVARLDLTGPPEVEFIDLQALPHAEPIAPPGSEKHRRK
jgi:putative phosphoesterase